MPSIGAGIKKLRSQGDGMMGTRQQQVQVTRRSSDRRDDQLRAAHKEAFDKILEARSTPGYQETVHDAVTQLIEACENYVAKH